jgi:NAD(P)-dependent dehydrogenase (short-subunit alcohol dehydrogenase family)
MNLRTGAGENWLVTGAARGIGLAVVQAHLARGGKVLACLRDTPTDGVAALVAEHGPRLRLLTFDLRDGAAILRAASEVDDPIDVLFNNAGIYGPRADSFRGLDGHGCLDAVDVNAFGALRVIDAFLPQLQKTARPRIVAVSSLMGAMGHPGTGSLAYRVSKAALNKAMQTVAEELRPLGVSVACLRPGAVTTRMNPRPGQMSPEESAAHLLARVDALTVTASPQFLDTTGAVLSW